jgi:hypothetical protein
MISFLSILAVGFFLGMRHASDPDHVIAVTTIVSNQRNSLGRQMPVNWLVLRAGVGDEAPLLDIPERVVFLLWRNLPA